MKISIFGMGYVGVVSSACLSKDGHHVVGVDPNTTKVDLINKAMSPIVEQGTGELIREAVDAGRLRATTNPREAVMSSELSLVCVGTPSQANGDLDLRYVLKVCQDIGEALRDKADFHIVVCRSTVLPGTMRGVVIPMLEEHSGKQAGRDFGVCNNPEFLREGTAVHDFYHPPKTVIGQTDVASGDRVASLYEKLDAPVIRTEIETAEMVKYADNVWHALKVDFANEIGRICKRLGIDSHRVMDVFCQDTKLNLSPYYLVPGFAFGGSCLRKDVCALAYKARTLDVEVPVLNSVLPSNLRQIDVGLDMIMSLEKKRIGILGFSFKAGTDDLRESPLVEVIERLLGKGYDIRIYDRNVSVAKLVGANRDYLLNHIPHISGLMVETVEKVLQHAEVIVIGYKDPEFEDVLTRLRPDQVVVDLVRITPQVSQEGRYHGLCW